MNKRCVAMLVLCSLLTIAGACIAKAPLAPTWTLAELDDSDGIAQRADGVWTVSTTPRWSPCMAVPMTRPALSYCDMGVQTSSLWPRLTS